MTITLPDNWATLVGAVAAREFDNAADHYKPGLIEWALNLPTLTDDDFLNIASYAISESASAGRFQGNYEHDHFKASACYTEAKRRHVVSGHAINCRGETLHGQAYAQALREHGHRPSPATSCTCGKEADA